jgi:hypothetical protein
MGGGGGGIEGSPSASQKSKGCSKDNIILRRQSNTSHVSASQKSKGCYKEKIILRRQSNTSHVSASQKSKGCYKEKIILRRQSNNTHVLKVVCYCILRKCSLVRDPHPSPWK